MSTKRSTRFLTIIASVFLLIIFNAVFVSAASSEWQRGPLAKNVTAMRVPTMSTHYIMDVGDLNVKEFKGATSSNTSVATVETIGGEVRWVEVYLKKEGSATITFKYTKSRSSKIYTYKFNIRILRYERPFLKLKVGKTDLTSKLNNSFEYWYFAAPKTKGKFNIKMKRNWKLQSIYLRGYRKGDKQRREIKKKATNQAVFNFKGVVWTSMFVNCKNTSNGMVVDFRFTNE